MGRHGLDHACCNNGREIPRQAVGELEYFKKELEAEEKGQEYMNRC